MRIFCLLTIIFHYLKSTSNVWTSCQFNWYFNINSLISIQSNINSEFCRININRIDIDIDSTYTIVNWYEVNWYLHETSNINLYWYWFDTQKLNWYKLNWYWYEMCYINWIDIDIYMKYQTWIDIDIDLILKTNICVSNWTKM